MPVLFRTLCVQRNYPLTLRVWGNGILSLLLLRLLFEVGNTRAGLTPQGKHMQFTRVAFSYHGNQLVVGDQHGNIYQLNMANNRCVCVCVCTQSEQMCANVIADILPRFKLVHKAGQACTALVACISRPNEMLVALADYSLKCIDTGK